MTDLIPFLRPSVPKLGLYQSRIEALDASGIYSNYGPLNTEFESRVLEVLFAGSGHVVTVSNATLGLALALRTYSRRGRYVIMPSFTFAATPLAAVWAGFEPYYVDIEPDSWTVSEAALDAALAELGDEVAAVMPYATFGANLDLSPYTSLVERGVPVIVDAAASLGSGQGNANFGTGFPGLVVFSMHATKPFGVGEGGLVYSADDSLISRLRTNGNFGFGKDRAAEEIGLNTKLPEILAAVAISTLEEFGANLGARSAVYEAYVESLTRHGLADLWKIQSGGGRRAHQFFPILVPEGLDRTAVVSALQEQGIQARTYFSPACHEQPALSGYRAGTLEHTVRLTPRMLSLPLWEGLTAAQVDLIVGTLKAISG